MLDRLKGLPRPAQESVAPKLALWKTMRMAMGGFGGSPRSVGILGKELLWLGLGDQRSLLSDGQPPTGVLL